jgi:hypothetical protein
MKLILAMATMFASLVAPATQVPRPPVDQKTLVGTWEALLRQHPPLLFHMEIRETGDSYLVQVTVGDTEYVVRRLVTAEVKDGNVRLHFKGTPSKELENVVFYDVWIVGSGNASLDPDAGVIEGRFCICDDVPPPGIPPREQNNIMLIKGAWTRDLGEASKHAEEEIKQAILTGR